MKERNSKLSLVKQVAKERNIVLDDKQLQNCLNNIDLNMQCYLEEEGEEEEPNTFLTFCKEYFN